MKKKVPEQFPWKNWEELTNDLENEWTFMKDQGLKKGYLKKTKEGYLKGQGDPNNWFDAITTGS